MKLCRMGLVLGVGMVWAVGVVAWGAEGEAEVLLGKIEGMKAPVLDQLRREDPANVAAYLKTVQEAERKRGELVKEFYARFPEHPKALGLMCERWRLMTRAGQSQEVIDETALVLAKMTDAKQRVEVLYQRAQAQLMVGKTGAEGPAVEAFLQAAPEDERGAALLVELGKVEEDSAKRLGYYQRAASQYGTSHFGQMAKGLLRQEEGVGKPFELTFTDAISGKEISLQKDLKGKVVVIDFWATWCGPCVAEMPKHKELYAKYKDRGMAFIGVSLDQPGENGINALKAYVAKEELTWLHYYEGEGFESAFSRGWGIWAIPTVFVVDKEGKLYSVKARGQLEALVPKLLAQ